MSEPEDPPHIYRPRQVPEMSSRFFQLGQGRISGYTSMLLGGLSLLAVLCYRYPSYLTTKELREIYDPEVLRVVLMFAMWSSLAFGVLTFVLNRKKRMGALGCMFTLIAFGLGGYRIEAGPVEASSVALGVDWLVLDLLGTGLAFVFIEKIVPKYEGQAILRPEWQLDLFYFALNHVLVSFFLVAGNSFAPTVFGWAVNAHVQQFVSGLPMFAQIVLLLACADFMQYWVHRGFHELPGMWDFHAVHHCTEHMDWLAGSRQHFVDTLTTRTLAMVPLYLLGADKAALDTYVVFAALQAVFIHANVRIEFGPLKYLLVTPQFHHWHHSTDKPSIDTNYAVHMPLWDKLFGTFHMPDEHWPAEYGTVTRLPRTFFGQVAYPFKRKSP